MNKRRLFQNQFPTVALLGTLIFSVLSCSDDNFTDNQESGDKGATVTFNVSSAQDEMLLQQQDAPAAPITRAAFSSRLAEQGLTMDDLASQKLEATNNAGLDVCLIETTVEGVNPIQPSTDTRANIKTYIDNRFSTSAYRGASSKVGPSPFNYWFYNKPTNSNGILVEPLQWEWNKPRYARFYSVYPEAKAENGITLWSKEQTIEPYVDFEVNKDVTKQQDLMTACSGVIHYATRYSAPRTELKFRHALTAVRFAVGENLSWNKKIDKVEIRNAVSKGRYILPSEVDGTKGTGRWAYDASPTRGNFTLEVPAPYVSTSSNPNTIIMGKNNDNFTFYMIPQYLTGRNVIVAIHFTDNKTITVMLKGYWRAGTTKTYKLSQRNSSWEYVLDVKSPTPLKYDQTITNDYTITSYRKDPGTGVQHAVKWSVVGYQESTDGGVSWSSESTTKPSWLTGITALSGNGGTAAESGKATIRKDYNDRMFAYNNILKNATPKGSAGNYYNLSNSNGADAIQNTANSYLISAPGFYRIPLVYGNARKNNTNNTNSYISTAPVVWDYVNYGGWGQRDVILHKFLDHKNAEINSPYINVQNAANPATKAGIVWTDQSGIIKSSSLSVVGTGQNSFVQFEVTKEGIKNGNAVIAVKDANGTIMWSWHLWFEHKEALNKIACTNFQGKVYNFTKNTLGSAVLKWESSVYDKPRHVRIKVSQGLGNGSFPKYAYITIVQNPGEEKKMVSTFYQFGRKDAMPGFNAIAEGNLYRIENSQAIGVTIQNPNTIYSSGGFYQHPYSSCYQNTWSANYAETSNSYNDVPVVKTIYDPCPVGFSMPPSNAFTGFTKTGQEVLIANMADLNVNGPFNRGWNFWTNNSKTESIFFPACGSRMYPEDDTETIPNLGFYWTATPHLDNGGGWGGRHAVFMHLGDGGVNPRRDLDRAFSFSVRPISELQ